MSPRTSVDSAPPSLARPVWLLGWVSLVTDSASEAIYPLLPYFLTQVLGAGAVSLGVIEGAAEAANSLLKIWSGRASDRRNTRRPLVFAGYALSSLARPAIALAQTWLHVFAVRLVDRIGQGVRSAPRDAMLASWTTESTRGRVYGFHRGMDHAGAVLGPVLATAFLFFYPGQYRTLFGLAIIPGAIAVALIPFVREGADGTIDSAPTSPSPRAVPSAPLPFELRSFFLVLAFFTLGSSTDAFLLLRLGEVAGGVRFIPLIWAALHVVKATTSMAGGVLSDKVGRRAVIASGWLVYAAVYAGFAVATDLSTLLAWFLVYGLYYGLTEGTEKALVADLAPEASRGFAFGLYNAVSGIGGLIASVVFGLLWTAFGTGVAFGTGAAISLVAIVLLFAIVRR